MPNSPKNTILFSLIANGDKKAFDKFFAIYYNRLVSFSNHFLSDRSSAEDIVSEVLTNLLIEKERIFRLKNFEAYLYTAVKNKSLTLLAKSKRELKIDWTIDSAHCNQEVITPQELLEEQELGDFISKVEENLPDRRKMVFRLARHDGLTYKQIGEIMNISERTVEVHLKLAIQCFRKEISSFLNKKEIPLKIRRRKIVPMTPIFLLFAYCLF
ncbi:RNA polymerase sigma-70 factor [Cyclobacterium amurskyense]|uniref:RNA polymerase, sigma-24 subunit, ECF subfamily n=1 Tax=Cyclobacterium amurskyense TaxID=320787 RepID=A0A0H4PH34_9BACT|nr:RNA polymerase sigma-70 factor [Cyclobacterium amurskyense]AKP53474.1 hypothetical protein CA2015_4121 [Cyclobacterium amurskyense]